MTIGAMGAVNIVSALGSASGSAAGGSSASSGQGGAGIGFNLLGAPGDPFGVGMKLIQTRKARKEEKRQFDKQMELQDQQTKSLMLANQEAERKLQWSADLRKMLLRGGV